MHDERLAFAIELAREAGRRSLSGFGRVEAEHKAASDGYDMATAVDREVEDFVKARITDDWDEPVLGEEGGLVGDPVRARCGVWVVDPIDGTFNFQHGIPLFGVSVAYCAEGVPVVAAIYLPATDETFAAAAGAGAWHLADALEPGDPAAEPLVPSPATRPEDVLIALGGRDLAALTAAFFERDLPRRCLRVFLCATASLSFIAAGRLNAYVQSSLNVWDCAAGDLLLREAGAPPCRDARGQPIFPTQLEIALRPEGPRDFVLLAAGNESLMNETIVPLATSAGLR